MKINELSTETNQRLLGMDKRTELISSDKKEELGLDTSNELDTRLKDLQAELKSEWSELRSQREKLTSVIEEVSKVRFMIDSNRKLNNDIEVDETINDSEESISEKIILENEID